MGYQEYLVQSKSSKLPLEKLSEMIDKKYDPMFLESLHTIATLQNDFSSDKVIMFGQEVSINPVNFKAGQQFLVLAGERRDASKIFPPLLRNLVNVYPLDTVMNSPQNIGKEYESVFSDSKIQSMQKDKRSVIDKLKSFKETSAADKKDVLQHEHKRDDNVR